MSNILSMSDEEIMSMAPDAREALMAAEPAPTPVVDENEQQEQQQPAAEPVAQEPVVEEEQEKEEGEQDPVKAEGEQEGEQDPEVQTPVKEQSAKAEVPAKPDTKSEPVKEEPSKATETPTQTADEQLAKLFTAFKASGRDFKVNSVDEAIQLMQKGVNYHDKMHGLKPLMGIGRMLERAGLMDETKLSYLIDLHDKKPEAIAKLIKESGVDPLELDEQKVAAYKPTVKSLTVEENALEDALSDLQQYDSHDRVIKMVNSSLDVASRQAVLKNPSVMLHFADQMQSGVYDLIKAEMDKQRILGNLKGLNDLQAYDQIGNALNAQGAFNHLGKPKQQEQVPPVVVAPRTPAAKPDASAKKAAAPAKTSAAPKAPPKQFDPLAMSDEEFLKLAGKPL